MADPGLRDRKKVRTRKAIEDAALSLFETQGFDATTIDEIVTKAEIAPRTFFRYFETKEDVVLADYSAQLDHMLTTLDERPTTEHPWVSLRLVFHAMVTDPERRAKMLPRARLMANAPSVFARSLQLQAGWELALSAALFERSKRGPGVRPEVDEVAAGLMAAAALGVMRTAIRHWINDSTTTDLSMFIDDCFARLADGFAASVAPHPPAVS